MLFRSAAIRSGFAKPALVGCVIVLCAGVLQAQVRVARVNPGEPAFAFDSPVPAKGPADPAQFDRWRSSIRSALLVPDPLPPLKAHVFGEIHPADGVSLFHVTYGTKAGMRIPANVYVPSRSHGRVPGIIIVCGHGGDKTTWYSVYSGLLYSQAGAVVLTYDPLGEDERNSDHRSDARAHDAVIPGARAPLETGSLMLTDILQGVSYLRSRTDVDPEKITLLAYSMGTIQGALAAAIDPRIKIVVLSAGGNLDGKGGVWDTENKPMCQASLYRALDNLPDKAAIVYALHQRVGPTLILNGRLDPLVARPHHFDAFFSNLADRVAALAGPQAPRLEYRFFPDAGHRPSWLTLGATEWLNSHLHFKNWSGKDLSSLGTTHISEWAARTGVHINTGYADEVREGGIEAVGQGLPGISRADLQAVPEAIWSRDKDRYIWQAWQNRVLTLEGLPLSLAVKPPPPR